MPTAKEKAKAAEVLTRLKKRYPDAECALKHENAWQLLVATILSAQCTDVRVNMVTPVLFNRFPTPEAMASANPAEVEEIIKSTGFFRQKTKSILEMSQDVADKFGGKVPEKMEELTKLRGVGRKTANVIIGTAFGGAGVVVDTHVKRLSRLLGWTKQEDPEKIEQDLMELFPKQDWTPLGHTLIWHGRTICIANRPKCWECPVLELCPGGQKYMSSAAGQKAAIAAGVNLK